MNRRRGEFLMTVGFVVGCCFLSGLCAARIKAPGSLGGLLFVGTGALINIINLIQYHAPAKKEGGKS